MSCHRSEELLRLQHLAVLVLPNELEELALVDLARAVDVHLLDQILENGETRRIPDRPERRRQLECGNLSTSIDVELREEPKDTNE